MYEPRSNRNSGTWHPTSVVEWRHRVAAWGKHSNTFGVVTLSRSSYHLSGIAILLDIHLQYQISFFNMASKDVDLSGLPIAAPAAPKGPLRFADVSGQCRTKQATKY